MQKITPHLWFDKEAQEAAKLYMSLFENSKVLNSVTLHDTPSKVKPFDKFWRIDENLQ